MKLRFLCFVLFALAVIVGCDSMVVDNDPYGIVDTTEKPTYIALDLSTSPNTYAGETSLKGFVDERNIENVAVFLYKVDIAMNTFPECYSFLPASSGPITMKITSGTKKVFVAVNVGTSSNPLLGSSFSYTPTIADDGQELTVHFNVLNPVIWSSGTTSPGWSFTPPPNGSEEGSANGLIKTLAGGTSSYYEGLTALAPDTISSPNRYYLLSNWDNAEADSVGDNLAGNISTCLFTFDPDVSKSDAVAGIQNAVTINVQLAVAKATMKFIAPLHSDGYSYLSDGSGGDKGFFTPWNATTTNPGIFTAGNINKLTTVFQKFSNGSVSDDNYSYISGDTVGGNNEWYRNFDNTRVFGTGKLFGTSANTVTNIYNAMTGSQDGEPNSVRLGMDTLYLTENAQENTAGYQDNSTFLVVGGKYNPKNWISDIQQSVIISQDPVIAYNGYTIPPSTPAGAVFPGTDYAPVPYSSSPISNDTLYYHTQLQLFIHGKENLYKYYAWVKKLDTTPNPEYSVAVLNSINSDIENGTLTGYYQGNCFYRVFIVDYDAARMNERVLVRRNHTYDVIISKILGPGIDDASLKQFLPEQILPMDPAYGAFTISISDQHKVTQMVEVSRQ